MVASDKEKILILDFGSQYTQLIARRIREQKVYCEIHPFNIGLDGIKNFDPIGIVLSGGPASVNEKDAPKIGPELFSLNVPILGICYGMQLLTLLEGGEVCKASQREYGRTQMTILSSKGIFAGFSKDEPITVWMSHGDRIERMPSGYISLAITSNSPVAAMADSAFRRFGVQFHPEVVHTPRGREILANFLFEICGSKGLWTMSSFIEATIKQIRERVRDGRVVCGLSGGVDSSVVAVLLHKALGDRVVSIFVNNGVLRKNEPEEVVQTFTRMGIPIRYVDASDRFLSKLAGVTEPEQKRKIIGSEFIAVFEQEARQLPNVTYLAQGTLYPDVIESVSYKGPSATIKSHHNVGGLPERMNLELIEPLRELFKDEVRELARELNLPQSIIIRQPFPGPGLAIRILGEVTKERVNVLQHADAIIQEEMLASSFYEQIWQSFGILLPVRTVGVMGDERTYENVIVLRVVQSIDGMTADWVSLPSDLLGRISNRIINEVRGVNRVVYDISSKPPSTIEWE